MQAISIIIFLNCYLLLNFDKYDQNVLNVAKLLKLYFFNELSQF